MSALATRVRSAGNPRRIWRSVVAAAIVVGSAPLVVIVVMLAFGSLVGTQLAQTATEAVTWAASVAVILTLLAVLDLLLGIITVARIHHGEHLWPALGGALLSLPRLLVALIALLLAIVVLVLLWPVATVVALTTALVLRIRRAAGVRIALLAAIPFLPVLVALAMLPASVAAAVGRPRSMRALVRSALSIVRTRLRPLLAYIVVTSALSAGLTWVGTSLSGRLDAAGQTDASLLVVALTLVLLMVTMGTALSVAIPPRAEGPTSRSRPLPRLRARVAVLLIASLVVSVLPVVSASPASAEGLIVPEVWAGRDGYGPSPLLSAEVHVPDGDPNGSVQFYDGGTAVGAPVRITPSGSDPTRGTAYLTNRPVFAPGLHPITVAFTPDSPLVEPATSGEMPWQFTATTIMAITVDAAAAVGSPADVTVTLAADFATTVAPAGTVLIEWEGGSDEVALVGGVAHLTIAELLSPGIAATYAGSTDFTPVSTSIQVGESVEPEDTVVTATIFDTPYPLGSELSALVTVEAPNAPYGTTVRGGVRVYAGALLLAETSSLTGAIQIPTEQLHVGTASLRFEFVPGSGFATSESTAEVELVKATTSAQATLSDPTIAWGDALTLTVVTTSSIDGQRTVEVLDTVSDTVVATSSITVVDGTSSTPISLSPALRPGAYALVATVLGDGDREAAVSASSTSQVASARTSTQLTVTPNPAEVGQTVTITATPTSTAGLSDPVVGHVTFQLPDGTQPQVALTAGTASLEWVPTYEHTGNVTASFFDPTFVFAGSSALRSATFSLAVPPAPTSSWSGSLTPSDRTLTLTYAAAADRDVPTGTVRIFDDGGLIAIGFLVDGEASIFVAGTLGTHPVITAQYMGDSIYASRTDLVSVVGLQNYAPTVTLTAPATVDLAESFTVSVDVGDVPPELVQQVTVTSTAPGGAVTTIGTVELDFAGHGSTETSLLADGTHQINAIVSFVAGSELSSLSSTAVPVAVTPVPVPSLVVSSPTIAPVAGGSLYLDVTAGWIDVGTTGVPAGTTAEIRDDSNAVLGTVTLLGGPGIEGYRGRLQLTNVHGGTMNVHAVVSYGPMNRTASSPVFPVVVAAPETYMGVQTSETTVGSPMTVTVTVVPYGNIAGPSRSLAATVTVGAAQYPLTVTRTASTGAFVGTVDVPTTHAGDVTVYASSPGDGIDASAASTTYYSSVGRRPTTVDVQIVQGGDAGDDVIVYARVLQTGTATSPAPTGTVTVVSSRTSALCTTDDEFVCTIPGSEVLSGDNGFTAYYLGDTENLASTGNAVHNASPRTSTLDVTFSPTIDAWVLGDPITATWTTTTSGATAIGAVDVAIAGAYCSGAAAAGSCTVTPTSSATTGLVNSTYRLAFRPFDDAPAAVVQGEASLYVCVFPYFNGTADYSAATRCRSGLGVVSGSLVRLSATPRENYLIDYWTANGVAVGTGPTPQVVVERSATYSYVERYAPVCFTLNLSPLRADKVTTGGYTTTYTTPNCSNPLTPTSGDVADLAAGRPRFVAGTTVYVKIVPNYGEPQLGIDTVIGASMVSDDVAQVVMDRDRTVSATFKVKACTAVAIVPSEGGTVALTSAARPASSATLKPSTGACTTVGGAAGYVPGTVLKFGATAATGSALHSWVVDEDYVTLAADDTAVVAVAAMPTVANAVPATRELVVGEKGIEVAARFSQVKCVSVTIVSRTVVSPFYTISEQSAPRGASAQGWDTEAGCGGIASTRTVKISGSNWYRIVTETKSYVASGRLDVSTAQRTYYPGGVGVAFVLWDTSTTQGVNRSVFSGLGASNYSNGAGIASGSSYADRASDRGPSLDLTAVPPKITVYADWVIESATECFAPKVTMPQGGSYILDSKFTDEPFCENPEFVANGEQMTFRAAAAIGAPLLTPLLTGAGRVQTMPALFVGSQSYVLEYCTPLVIDVRLHDDAGRVVAASAQQAKEWFNDDGGCPAGWTRPNRTVATAISGTGAVNYTVIGSPQGYGPTLTVDATGVVTGANRVDLKVICFTLNAEDASIETPGNCPGGAANRFLRGSQVRLQAGDADRFDGWYNVDAEQGESAWVIMSGDRTVTADLYNYSWYEDMGNALSSVAQRTVSALVTVGTGMVLAEVFLVKAAGWALSGTAAVLRAAGVNGSVVDGIDRAGSVVVAQFDAFSVLANCMTSAATGNSGALLTIPASGSAVPSGGSADDVVAAAKAQLAAQLSGQGVNNSIPLGSLLGKAGSVINVFGSGLSGYTADAASSWGNFGSSIGDCTQRGMQNYVATTYSR